MVEIEKPRIECIEKPGDNSYGKCIVEPLERGYGTTLGNSLHLAVSFDITGSDNPLAGGLNVHCFGTLAVQLGNDPLYVQDDFCYVLFARHCSHQHQDCRGAA